MRAICLPLVPRDAREKMYAVSPAAAELRSYMEGKLGDGWAAISCSGEQLPQCPQIFGGFFMWALRESAMYAGHHLSAPEAKAYYGRLAHEIDTACDDGRLDCLPRRRTLRPPFREEDIHNALVVSNPMLRMLLAWGDGQFGTAPSVGTPERLAMITSLVGPVSLPATNAQNLERREDGRQPLARTIGHAYAVVTPLLFISAVVGLFAAGWLFRTDRRAIALFAIGIAALIAVFSRVALLSYLEVTTIRSLFTLYLSPATPFVGIFIVIGNWGVVRALQMAWAQRRGESFEPAYGPGE